MICTRCGTANDEAFRFCLQCGNPLYVSSEPGTIQPNNPPSSQPDEMTNNPPPAPTYNPPQPVISPPLSTFQPQQISKQNPPFTAANPQYQQQVPQQPNWSPSAYFPEPQNLSMLNIWGPFAGFGTRRKHIGWLLDNKGDSVNNLIKQVKTLFQERQISGVSITEETLTARGLVVENRPYFLLRRRLASVGLYISQFGKDLFISQVSYLKPPISNFRVLVLIVMALFLLYTAFIFPNSLNRSLSGLFSANSLFGGSSGSNNGGDLTFLLCVIGPAGFLNTLALGIFGIYSVYKWLTEKDILAGLRTTPNEFNEDDLMAMEKASEQTVRLAMDDIGLNPDDLKATSLQNSTRII